MCRSAQPVYQTCATAALCSKSVPPQATKTSPESTRTVQSETNLCHVQAGALGGKFSVSEGGLEGESPVFQEGALSLQGLWSLVFPLPPRNLRTEGAELVDEIAVAALNQLNAGNFGHTARRSAGNDHRRTRT